MKKAWLLIVCCFGGMMPNLFAQTADSQTNTPKAKVSMAAYDGTVVVGYVDGGGFLNFTGPSINLTYQQSKFILSALPSLRFKEDTSTGTKNSLAMPSLGIGFTYAYRMLAFQIPFYYNSKTATKDGEWVVGFGIGLRLNPLNKPK